MKKGLWIVFLSALTAGLVGWSFQAWAESFARVSDVRGALNIKGGNEGEWTSATLNLLLREEDVLETGPEGTAEVEMPGLARVRMGARTQARIRGFGDSDHRDEIVVENGGVSVDDRSGTTVVETLSAAVSPNSGSIVRVDADKDGTRVRVSLGSAQVQTFENGEYSSRPLLLRTGEEMVLDVGARPEGPYVFTAGNDTLDRYAKNREEALGRTAEQRSSRASLDQPLMGADELDDYGTWVAVSGTRVWRPRVAPDWRPYSYGYWGWYDPYGWTWISYEPWGYATFHYGAWNYDSYYGWCWYPGYVWRPAYVSWVSVGPYYAWAPVNPWGQVVVIKNTVIVNQIDRRVFTVAPRTAFVIGPKAIRPGGGRIIPHEMRERNVIRAPDSRMFTADQKIERIKDFNTAQPVRIETGVKDQKRREIGSRREERPAQAVSPRPGRSFSPGMKPPERARERMPREGAADIPRPAVKPEKLDRTRTSPQVEGPAGRRDVPRRGEIPPPAERRSRTMKGPEIQRDTLPPADRSERSMKGPTEIRRETLPPADQPAKKDRRGPRVREERGKASDAPVIERHSVPAPGGGNPGIGKGPVPKQKGPSKREMREDGNPQQPAPSQQKADPPQR